MTRFQMYRRFFAGVLAFGACLCLSAGSYAQGSPMGWNDVRVVTVKAGSVGEFEDLLGELNAALAEAGEPVIAVFQVVHGEQNTYHLQSTLQSLSEFEQPPNPPMPPGQMAQLFMRLMRTIDSQERSLVRLTPELWIFPGQDSEMNVSGLWVMRRETILPGRNADYLKWYQDDLLPALREAGVQALFNNRIVFGGNDRTYVAASPLASWGALDGPGLLQESLGEPAAERLIARGDALIENRETLILRQRPDLMGAD